MNSIARTLPLCLGALALALTTLVAPRAAVASQNFPIEVQKEWQLANPPDCTVCHQSDQGGEGTATKAFSRTLQREGLVEEDLGSLDKALAADKAQSIDSDGDGIPDFDELQMGLDPNDGPGAFGNFPIPETGCALSLPARPTPGDAAPWLGALATIVVLGRRRRTK
ncbi:MAG TPA: thrombospondin type 3 repeat-containing protein [Polyangiaceae bacterium]|jgi:hypothetical protein|nr:thrombospondin type 3 repeat-containing protein [Polyangiaceae bacterium]